MKSAHFLIIALLFTACGGRKMTVNLAEKVIAGNPKDSLEKKDIEVVKVMQTSGSEAIVETRLKTAFRLEKVKGHWVVKEVRLGHDQWETVDDVLQALKEVRIKETEKLLDRIAEAIVKYREINGTLPAFKDYIALSDLLSPAYLTPLVRLDAWRRPLEAKRADAASILLISAGPDGQFGTGDDIRRTVP